MGADQVVELLVAAGEAVQVTPLVTPIGVARRREEVAAAVTSGVSTVARWDYPPFDSERAINSLGRAREELAAGGHPLADLVAEELDSLDCTIVTFAARSDAGLVRWAVESYGLPDAATLAVARDWLGEPYGADEGPAHRDAEFAVGRLASALEAYGLTGWEIRVDPQMAARMSIRPISQVIRVRADTAFGDCELDRLIVHEIGGHVLRTTNAKLQPEPLARISLGRAAPTEEGLAAWLESDMHVSSPRNLRTYAARALAVDHALQAGVVQVAAALEPAVGLPVAAEIAVRVKRGLQDPNEPGCYSRDHGYLTGYLAVSAELAHDRGLLPLLMATKWPLEMLSRVIELVGTGQLRPAQYLPERSRLLPA